MTAAAHSTRRVQRLSCGIYMFVGCAHVFWGTVSPHALTGAGGGSTLSILVTAQFSGFLVGVLSAPHIGARMGVGRHVAAALSLFAVAISVPIWSTSTAVLTTAGAVFGIAAGSLETQLGALALGPGRGPRALTALEVCFGVGALLFPVYFFALSLVLPWRLLVGVLVAAAALTCLAWITSGATRGVRHDEPPTIATRADAARTRPAAPTGVGIVLLIFAAVYAGFETNFANFLPQIVDSEDGNGHSVLAVAAFWLGITVGRLIIAGYASTMITMRALVVLSAALGIVLIGLAYGGGRQVESTIWIILAGIAAAGIFPIALTYATRWGALTAQRMTSYFVAAASLGGAVIALPVGVVLDHHGARAAILLFAVGAGALLILSMAARRLAPRTQPQSA